MTPRSAVADTATETDRQGRVLDFLQRSAFSLAEGGRRIDTHASVVFLGNERLLKIKRGRNAISILREA